MQQLQIVLAITELRQFPTMNKCCLQAPIKPLHVRGKWLSAEEERLRFGFNYPFCCVCNLILYVSSLLTSISMHLELADHCGSVKQWVTWGGGRRSNLVRWKIEQPWEVKTWARKLLDICFLHVAHLHFKRPKNGGQESWWWGEGENLMFIILNLKSEPDR